MGIPCVTAEAETVRRLQEAIAVHPQTSVQVNLDTMHVHCGDFSAPISIGEGSRNMFLTGTWDACGQLVAQANQIRATATKLPYVNWSSTAS